MEVKIGSLVGRERFYKTTYHIEELKRVASELANGDGFKPAVPATNFHLYYDAPNDFHHLEFMLDGVTYNIRYYKVFCVTKSGKDKLFGRDRYPLVDFFLSRRFEQWTD